MLSKNQQHVTKKNTIENDFFYDYLYREHPKIVLFNNIIDCTKIASGNPTLKRNTYNFFINAQVDK